MISTLSPTTDCFLAAQQRIEVLPAPEGQHAAEVHVPEMSRPDMAQPRLPDGVHLLFLPVGNRLDLRCASVEQSVGQQRVRGGLVRGPHAKVVVPAVGDRFQ